jgi:Short-chain alcohol dehydrogenase of unknown specificity
MAINGKVVLVTGSAQGIGRGIALRLAKDGADICLVDMNADKLAATAGEVRALGRKATTFIADVSDRAQVFAAVDHAEKELGGFDVMVNNAGIAQVKALLDVTPEELERIFRINVNGVLWGIQAAATKFMARKPRRARSSAHLPLPARWLCPYWRVQRHQVCRARPYPGGSAGACLKRHYRKRILPRRGRHRHVGGH